MDKIDPICGMKGHIKAHNHYFCSKNCLEKYEQQHNLKTCPSCISTQKKPFYKEKLYIFGLITILLFFISYILPPLNPLFEALMDYLELIWWAILLGLFIGGIIDRFIPREYISRFLSTHKKVSIFYAVIFGFLMSACSHGILAIAIQLHKKGASVPSVIAFLLASPWANLPITILLIGFFGIKSLFLIFTAILIAIITGLIYQLLDKKKIIEHNPNEFEDQEKFSIIEDVKKRYSKYKFSSKDITDVFKGMWSLSKMVVWWILIGMILASFARAFIPQEIFVNFLGPTVIGLLLTLVFATIIEVCSEGSAPLAFEIFNQTGAFGNSFTFLMAGVATDYTEIGLIWSNIGRKAALYLPIITVPQILVFGYLFNILL